MSHMLTYRLQLTLGLMVALMSLGAMSEEEVYGCIYESGAHGGFKLSVDDELVKYRDLPAVTWKRGNSYGCSLYRLIADTHSMQLHCWNEFQLTFWATLIMTKSGESDRPAVRAKCVRTG